MEFDYVIVGAGSAGCVLANRLSVDPTNRVLLLEAGPEDRNFWIHVPLGFGKNVNNPSVNWCYQSEPEPNVRGQRFLLPRGRVLGGSSSINGMVYVRGQPEDFDHWAQLGNGGWSCEDLLPYFKKSENNTRGANHFHGIGGPLSVSDLTERAGICEYMIRAGEEIGIPRNDDLNGQIQEGIGYHQATIRNGRRCSTAKAFLEPVRSRQNLSVETEALATRILFNGKRATGVLYVQGGVTRQVRTTREVIVSGGAFNSPQLLELSGVGQGKRLQALGIPVVHSLSGVGEDLQDHQIVRMRWRITKNITWNEEVHGWRALRSALKFLFAGKGVLTMPTLPVGAFICTRQELATPDIQFQIFPGTYSSLEARVLDKQPGVTVGVVLLRPESRGTVHLKTPEPTSPPAILHNLLQTERDRETIVRGMKLCRRLMDANAMDPIRGVELYPGCNATSDKDLLEAALDVTQSNWHPTSTCRMGTDPMAVVDPTLKVHGLERLRIADASVMPTAVSGNTNATCIMIGEKASDIVLQQARGRE